MPAKARALRTIDARKTEIGRRHDARAQELAQAHGRPSISALRYRELIRLVTYRYGPLLPNDDAGFDDADIIIQHLASLSKPRQRIRNFIETKAPWLLLQDPRLHDYPTSAIYSSSAAHLINEAIAYPARWTADTLAWRLGLRSADRQRLGIKTVGCIEFSKEERKQLRKEKDRERKAIGRRAKGARPRTEYEKRSDQRLEPWKELGMSRATWFRKGKPRP